MLHCHCRCAASITVPALRLSWPRRSAAFAGAVVLSTSAPGILRNAASAVSAPRCRSKVPGVNDEAQQVFMPAGALDGELGIRPQMHCSRLPGQALTRSMTGCHSMWSFRRNGERVDSTLPRVPLLRESYIGELRLRVDAFRDRRSGVWHASLSLWWLSACARRGVCHQRHLSARRPALYGGRGEAGRLDGRAPSSSAPRSFATAAAPCRGVPRRAARWWCRWAPRSDPQDRANRAPVRGFEGTVVRHSRCRAAVSRRGAESRRKSLR